MFQFVPMSDRIRAIRARRDAFTSGKYMTINTERTKLYTDYYKAHENEYPMLKRANALYNWVENREIKVFDDDIFVGVPGPEQRCLSPYVEWDCKWIPSVVDDEEAFKEAWQTEGSIYMSDEQREVLREAYDYWKDRTLTKMVTGALTEDFWEAAGNGCILNMTRTGAMAMGVSGIAQGHYIGNFNKVVNVGFGEVRRQVLEKLDAMKGKVFGDDAKKHIFYYAILRVCDAAILLAKRYAEACRDKAQDAIGERKEELLRMAESLDRIMDKPARTFWEGLQAIILYQLMLSTDAQQHGQSIGRVDQYVGHLLEAELAEGKITDEQAQEYSDAFILRLSDIIVLPSFASNSKVIDLKANGKNLYNSIYNGLTPTAGIALTLGGMKPDGTDGSNAATRKLLQTYGRMGFPDPTVALRICKTTPDDVWRLGIESSKRCGGIPQFQNDDLIVPMMVEKLGFTIEEARDYSIVGCVEPAGTGNEWPACGMTGRESIWNMVNMVVMTINGGVNKRSGKTGLPCKKLYEYESFDEFKAAFEAQMQNALDWSVSYSNTFELVYSHYFPCVVASSMMEGCLESGKDVTEGGAKHNRCGLTAIGTANVGDSLMTIKKLCFDDKTVSLRELYDALEADWEGYEDLRQTIINAVPHYGNDIDEVDDLASWALGKFADIMSKETGPRGNYSGGTFTMTAHIYSGATTAATPDGRKAGEPLADAISSRQGLDRNGPTAYIRSAAKLPQSTLTNGDQLNIRFSPKSVEGDEGAMKLRQLIATYFMLGGMQVQFNVVSSDQLHEAQAKPIEYQDLVVRIAGFSTYFVSLDKKTQDDFITRTEQSM
jgi:formate C-acetyltransferase